MAFMNRPMQKVILNSSTKMSLHERFTYLRSQSAEAGAGGSGGGQRQTVAAITSKNRRLAQQMERRPAVMAALKIKKRSLKQRLGQTTSFGSIKDRLTLTRRGSLRGGRLNQIAAGLQRRGRTRGRRQIGGGLSRSQSMQSLNGSNTQQRMRSRSRSRSRVRSLAPSGGNMRRGGAGAVAFRRGGGGGPGANWMRERVNVRGGGMRGGGGGGGGVRGMRRGFSAGGGANWRGRSFQGQRGRGNFRGRGSRGGARGGRGNWRGRGGGNRGTVPTKEELDSQLDQYMASSQNAMDLA
ncbi:chromatin target of PRMT1 protein-like [Nilaparvata lugens]|uniref:chromatin target of PRMT1 protein-like n=1 Tax=Nilaparvata lugens TaxID=108931 RepID=UPI000B97FA68|nr:chromatin target of PRMT1 protein-like [Nilaparvata lugens]XP_039281752.1 chromatin target of PRMT1 protein-like [Nilaparvata lugens]